MYKWLGKLLSDLSKRQNDIDLYIHNQNQLSSKETWNKRIIALFTEIAEFANEIRSFKYWSKKSESNREIILEEYIDCVHFLLSIGNNINFDWLNYKFVNQIVNDNIDINYFILEININLSIFAKDNTHDNFQRFLNNFFTIAIIKNFTKEELFDSYVDKNQKNYHRQEINY